MCFALMHLSDEPAVDEEAYVFVPDTTKTVIAVPLDALPAFLPLLAQALDGSGPVCCPTCAARLPAGVFTGDPDAEEP